MALSCGYVLIFFSSNKPLKDLGMVSQYVIVHQTLKFKEFKLLAPTNKAIKCHINIFSNVDNNDKNIHNVRHILEFFKSIKSIQRVKIWKLTYDLMIL